MAKGAGAERRSVLVVEDNDINREILCALLEGDFDVYEAENGEVGLGLLAEHYRELSMVVLDIHMPVVDGLEFLRVRAADERYAPIPVVVATASGSVGDELECLKLGANDFVVKPYNFDIMMNRIANLIQLRESASIVNQLMTDELTGLSSKAFFYRHVEDALRASPEMRFDIACTDIEGFKALNDRYGNASCDAMLRGLADAIVAGLPDMLEGGRIGGDVFAFLVPHGPRDWRDVLASAVSSMPPPALNVKLGVVEDVDHSLPVPISCDRALTALETVKGPLGVGVGFYDDELRRRQQVAHVIVDSAEAALENREFRVFFQPKHDVRTGRVGGAEALVRWVHPELGLVSPGEFIALFERNGFIAKLDMHIWEEACRQVRRMADLGLPAVPVSVNASRLDFDMPDLARRLAGLADRYGVDRGLLHVELTESIYGDSPEAVARALAELRAAGFKVELDDFGAGYSSLATLNTLPLDVMKLDMSLVRHAVRLDDWRIVRASLQLAQLLGLESVVEGVETAEEAEAVKGLGCDMIQGFYYSRPLSREDFEDYLLRGAGARGARGA